MVKIKIDKRNSRFFAIGATVTGFLIASIYWHMSMTTTLLPLTPWASIGGCGAGGSGGAGSGEVKWIGRGESGGLLDLQVLSNLEIGQTRRNMAFAPRLTIKPSYTSSLSLTIPVLSKEALFQPQTNLDPRTEVTGGIGDLLIDYSKSFGISGEYSLQASLTLPTGQYDIVRGAESSPEVLSNTLQLGSGVYTASLGLGYVRDFDKGMLLIDCMYLHPFAFSFTGTNPHNDASTGGWGYQTDLMTGEQKQRFNYYFKPYGENDLGGYTPPSVYAAVYYGDKHDPVYVSSYGFSLSVPLGVTWIPSYVANSYDPIPDPDFWTWSGTLQYGLELSNERHPVYFVVQKMIHDRSNPPGQSDRYNPDAVNHWDGPDWRDFAYTWSFTIGVRTSLF
jgi:hypothetical protein